MMHWIVKAIAIASLACATSAGASLQDFLTCDGFLPPSRKTDGLAFPTFGQSPLLAAPGERIDAWTGPEAYDPLHMTACDAALAQMEGMPQHNARIASLHRAKALHAAAGELWDQAMQALNAAEAAAPRGDIWHDRSGGVAAQMIRATIHAWKGERGLAIQAARKAALARPYAFGPMRLFAIINAHAVPNSEAIRAGLVAAAAVTPAEARSLLDWEWSEGQFDAVVALRRHVVAPKIVSLPGIGGMGSDAGVRGMGLAEDSAYDARAALALAALGKLDEAEALLAERQALLDAALKRPEPGADGKPPSRQRMWDYRALVAPLAPALNDIRNARDRVVQFRQVVRGEAATVLDDVRRNPVPADQASLALLRLLKASLPAEQAFFEAERARIAPLLVLKPMPLPSVTQLASWLPEPESALRVPARVEVRASRDPGQASGMIAFLATGERSTGAATTELALLRLAEAAQAQGKTHVLLRRSTRFRRMMDDRFEGYSAYVEGRPVSHADVPPEEVTTRALMIDARRIVDELAPLYGRAATHP